MNHADVLRLARVFHDTYERLAPEFGYETRKETRAFDPDSPNGRLMLAVVAEVAALVAAESAKQMRERCATLCLDFPLSPHPVVALRDVQLAEAIRALPLDQPAREPTDAERHYDNSGGTG